MGDPVGERVRLARPGPGDHQERPGDAAVAMEGGPPLLGVQAGEVVGVRLRITDDQIHGGA